MDPVQERDELRSLFDLRWKADMRAIEMWQEAHPGNDLVWPDHGDMVTWLLERLDGQIVQGWNHTFPWRQHAGEPHLFDSRCVVCGLRAVRDYTRADVDSPGRFELTETPDVRA